MVGGVAVEGGEGTGVDDDATMAAIEGAEGAGAAGGVASGAVEEGVGVAGAADARSTSPGTVGEGEGAEVVGLGTEAFLGGIMTTNALSEKSVSSACESARICSRAWI